MSLNQTSNPQCERINTIITLLNTTIPLLWVILGTITNGLTMFVFSRRSMRYNSTFTYLALMTLCDFTVIWFTSFRDFLVYKYDFKISGTLLCRLHVFIFFLSCQFSSWLLTAANIDRLVYVICYAQAKKWCNRTIAFRVAFAIFILLVAMNFHFLLFVFSDETISKTNPNFPSIHSYVYPNCLIQEGAYESFYKNYYSWMDAFVFSFIPFLIMSICNTALIIKVFSTRRNLTKKNPAKSEKTEELVELTLQRQNTSKEANLPAASHRTAAAHRTSIVYRPKPKSDASSERMRNMAITIIGCTLLFIMFTLPINIYVPISHSMPEDTSEEKKCDDLVFSILNNMVNANHSINFFIYLLTNSKFRKEIKRMLNAKRILLQRFLDVVTESCGFRIKCVGTRRRPANNQSNPGDETAGQTGTNTGRGNNLSRGEAARRNEASDQDDDEDYRAYKESKRRSSQKGSKKNKSLKIPDDSFFTNNFATSRFNHTQDQAEEQAAGAVSSNNNACEKANNAQAEKKSPGVASGSDAIIASTSVEK
jgi:hypothetical protein